MISDAKLRAHLTFGNSWTEEQQHAALYLTIAPEIQSQYRSPGAEHRRTSSARLTPAALQTSNSALALRLGLGGLVDDFNTSVLRGENVRRVLRSLLSIADSMEICGS